MKHIKWRTEFTCNYLHCNNIKKEIELYELINQSRSKLINQKPNEYYMRFSTQNYDYWWLEKNFKRNDGTISQQLFTNESKLAIWNSAQ